MAEAVILKRHSITDKGCFGTLTFMDQHMGVTLERYFKELKGPKIPEGTYNCLKGIHKLHSGEQIKTFEILGVPDHTGILFHYGNIQEDSNGCVLLGEFQVGDHIINSRMTFNEFMNDFGRRTTMFRLEVKNELA